MKDCWNPGDSNREVLRSALCLTTNANSFIEVILNKLIKWLRINPIKNVPEDFLKSLGKEVQNDTIMNIMHNKYFNYATQEDPVVHIPCRFYLCKEFQYKIPQFEFVRFYVDETGSADFSPAELSLSSTSTYSLNNALKIIKMIQRYQTVTIVKLHLEHICVERIPANLVIDGGMNPVKIALCDLVEKTLPCIIKFNENMGLLRLVACYFSKPVFEHLAEELYGCERMKLLSLRSVGNNFPLKLAKSIATMTSLEDADMYKFALTPEICRAVLRGLSVCSQLVSLNIGGTEMTDCLKYLFLDSSHCGFPSLEELGITDAKLSAGDLISITNAVRQDKLPRLKRICLARNILKSKVETVMGDQKGKYVVYPALEILCLTECKLNRTDIGSISQALTRNQLPQLQSISLGFNTLTDCIIDLFGGKVHSSFSTLTQLYLQCTQPNAADLRNLSRTLSQAVMSNCKTLDLSKNKLTGIIAELFAGNGLPFVNTLNLKDTHLNSRDRENIIDGIKSEKLPALVKLDLSDSKLPMLEAQLKRLCEACITHFRKHRINVEVSLDGFADYEKIFDRISELCKGTNVSLSWGLGYDAATSKQNYLALLGKSLMYNNGI